MKTRNFAIAVGLAIAVVLPASANATDRWWFDHREGRFPTAAYKKQVEPSLDEFWLTNEHGEKIGPCKGLQLKGEIHNNYGGMGEGTLNGVEGAITGCSTTVDECAVAKLEPAPSPSWKTTLLTSKEVEISNFKATVEWVGNCEGTTLPKEFTVAGTVKGTWIDSAGPGIGSEIAFDEFEVKVNGVPLYLGGSVNFGTQVTALTEPKGFTPTSSPATLDGTQLAVVKITRSERTVECQKSTLTATSAKGDTTITVTPTYESCKAGLNPATVKMNGCDYQLALNSEEDEGDYRHWATVALTCPAGQEVEVDVYGSHEGHTANMPQCRFNLSPASNESLERVDLANVTGEPSKITADIAIGKVVSKRTVGFPLLCGAEFDTAGTLEASYELEGTTDPGGEANGIWIFPG